MTSRKQLVAQAVCIATENQCVDIAGNRGSGLTRTLGDMRIQLLNQGWEGFDVRGITSFGQSALVDLAVAGVGPAREGRPTQVSSVVMELAERLPLGRSAIVVDDWDDVDEASWGCISTVQRRYVIPVLITRLNGRPARHTPTGQLGSSIETTFVVELTSMRYDEFASARGGPAGDSLTLVCQIRGDVGLAIPLSDAARGKATAAGGRVGRGK